MLLLHRVALDENSKALLLCDPDMLSKDVKPCKRFTGSPLAYAALRLGMITAWPFVFGNASKNARVSSRNCDKDRNKMGGGNDPKHIVFDPASFLT